MDDQFMPEAGPITYVGDMGALGGALAKAQGAMPAPKRSGKNTFFKRDNEPSKYATMSDLINSIRAPLAENGIAITQHAVAAGKEVTVTTVIMHASGARMSSPLTCDAKDASVQSIGSAITYLRRYGLISIIGQAGDDIEEDVVDDDDGNAAMGRRPADAPAPPAEAKKVKPRAARAEPEVEVEPKTFHASPDRNEDERMIAQILGEISKSSTDELLNDLWQKTKKYASLLQGRDERAYKKVLAAFTAQRVALSTRDEIPV